MIFAAVLLTVALAGEPGWRVSGSFNLGRTDLTSVHQFKMRSETTQTDHLTNSGLRFNDSCNAIDLGIECELVCWNESVQCGYDCGRNSSDLAVLECKENCIHNQFICVDGEFTILKNE